MKSEEKQLFLQLCRFRDEGFDRALLQYASPAVLGHLFFNRMQAAAYGVLKQQKALGLVSREFRNSLREAWEKNREKNQSFFRCVEGLARLLAGCGFPAAMLKGALLCSLYPEGYRTANDVDLLVMQKDVTALGELLTAAGFIQGYIRNGELVPASRREIIESRMMRGETVPYIREVNLPSLQYLEVDVNFSIDYKNGSEVLLKAMLERTTCREVGKIRIPTLCAEDFLIHLCGHLHKEASTLPWVQMKRDMTLYKFADIYLLLGKMSPKEISEMFGRAGELEMEKVCAGAVLQTAELFGLKETFILEPARRILKDDKNWMHRVISPADNKTYVYRTKSLSDRLFMEDREKNLREEKKNADTCHER